MIKTYRHLRVRLLRPLTHTGVFLFLTANIQKYKYMNDIQIFNNPNFGEIRTVINENGEPMFCLVDVCAALELTPKGVKQRLGDEVISNYPIIDTLGREQQALFVNEDGLYDTVLESRKPKAREFRKWVTSEVLPSIRKTGQYATKPLTPAQQLLANAQMLVEIEQRQMAQERRQIEVENKVALIEDRIRDNGYMAVAGFANVYKVKLSDTMKKKLGKLASSWCRRMGVLPEKIKHERWGFVNTYPMQALREVFKATFPDKSAMFDVPTYWV